MDEPWTQRPPPRLCGATRQWELVTPADLHFVRAEVRQLVDAESVVMDDARCERFLLAVEELASNGLRHGRAPVRARVVAATQGLLIEVSDSKPERAPEPALGRDPALGGLGSVWWIMGARPAGRKGGSRRRS